MKIRIVALLLALGTAANVYAASPFEGRWEGAITRDRASTPVVIEFREVDGELKGAVSYPRSGAKDTPVMGLVAEGQNIEFRHGDIKTPRVYKGALDGEKLLGSVSTEGKEMAFAVERAAIEVPYREEDITYTNGAVTIASTLFVPNGPGPHPALVMMHGSGENVRQRYRFLADFWARLGMACLIADKRGCGESTGVWLEADFAALATDGIEGVHLLQKRPDIDPKRVGMTGISQAGWVMTQAAALSKDVAFLVVDSGAAVTVELEGFFDYEVQLRDQGFPETDIRQALELLKLDNEVTRTGQGFEKVAERIKQVRGEKWFRAMGFVAPPQRSPFRAFYKSIIDFDPAPLLEGIDIPILWLYGEEDKSVDPGTSIAILERIQKAGGKDYTIKMFPRADHGLRVPNDPAKDAMPLNVLTDGYLDTKAEWVRTKVLARGN